MLPMTEWNLCRFGQYYSRFVTSADTVRNALYTLKTVNELAGYMPVPTSKRLDWLVKGLKKIMRRPIKQANAMNPSILKQISRILNVADPVDFVCYVICLVGFYLFLRSSNLVPESRNSFDKHRQLARQDIRICGNAIVVDIKWSKTIQFAEKLLQVPLLPVADEDICPVTWMRAMLLRFPAGPEDPAFCVPGAGRAVAVSYSQLAARLKKWSLQLKLKGPSFTPHCLRRGGTTFAQTVNIEGESIQLIGDWASQAYRRYFQWSFHKRYDVLKRIAEQAHKHTDQGNDFVHV